jgi:hypothetical protein
VSADNYLAIRKCGEKFVVTNESFSAFPDCRETPEVALDRILNGNGPDSYRKRNFGGYGEGVFDCIEQTEAYVDSIYESNDCWPEYGPEWSL